MKTKTRTAFISEVTRVANLGIPLVASQLIYASSGFIGTAMVARLGEDALAASVLVASSWLTLSVFFFGILNSIGVLVSHQYGAKNYTATSQTMGQGLILSIIMSIPIIVLLLLSHYLLYLNHQPPSVLHQSSDYILALTWTIPGLMILIVCEHFLAAVGLGKIVLIISILVVPIEIPIIYLLIFGKAGLPQCGIAGVGYGFAITYTITALSLLVYLACAKRFTQYAIFSNLQLRWAFTYEILKLGIPIGFSQVIEISTFAFVAFWIAQFGTTILAAHQIVMQYLTFVIPLVFAMAQSVCIRLGHAVGEQSPHNLLNIISAGMLLGFLGNCAIALCFYLVPHWFISIDVDIHNAKNLFLVQQTSQLFAVCALLLLFENVRIIGSGALRGLKDTSFVMKANLIALWFVGLTSAYCFAFLLHGGGVGVWWGLIVGMIVGAFLVVARLYYLLRIRS